MPPFPLRLQNTTYTEIFNSRTGKLSTTTVIRDADHAFIPITNLHYKKWLEVGNKPNPAKIPESSIVKPQPDESKTDMLLVLTNAVDALTRQVATLSEQAQIKLVPELENMIKERSKKLEE